MCDTIAGELLVCFHKTDPAGAALMESIRQGRISHVRLIEDLDHRVTRAGLAMQDGIEFKFFRLQVPVGQEAFKIGYLQFSYKDAVLDAIAHLSMDTVRHSDVLFRSNYHLQVVPHSILSVRSHTTALPSIGFNFTQTHADYKKLFGWHAPSMTSSVKRVLVLDTGLDPAMKCNVVDQANFVDGTTPHDISDDHGHGTAITSIIHDLCATAEFVIYKVADANGRASEWDTLAALAARSKVNLVNISLAFGLPTRICSVCGRESHSSRSAVFENMIDQLENATNGPLLVAAAGNEAINKLSFPARFDNIVAVASVNLAEKLSQFTNRAAVDHQGDNHQNVFVLPGGEKSPQISDPTEYVGTSSAGAKYYGTSFSTAYACGIIAALWSQPSNSGKDRTQLLEHLRHNANKLLPGYSYSTHGNGLMQFK